MCRLLTGVESFARVTLIGGDILAYTIRLLVVLTILPFIPVLFEFALYTIQHPLLYGADFFDMISVITEFTTITTIWLIFSFCSKKLLATEEKYSWQERILKSMFNKISKKTL